MFVFLFCTVCILIALLNSPFFRVQVVDKFRSVMFETNVVILLAKCR